MPKNYTPEELKIILDKHRKWSIGEDGGERADLSGANLSGAYLSGADLSCANLSGAYLSCANLSGANLSGADLSCANLSCANLSGADLSGANLSCANLSCADLSGADLSCANLSCANLLYVTVGWTDHGESGRQLMAIKNGDAVIYSCGCFSGSEQDLRDYITASAESLRPSRTLALEFCVARMAEMIAKRETVKTEAN